MPAPNALPVRDYLLAMFLYAFLPKSPGFLVFFLLPPSQTALSLLSSHHAVQRYAPHIQSCQMGNVYRGEFLICLPILSSFVLLFCLVGFDPLDLLLYSLVHSLL